MLFPCLHEQMVFRVSPRRCVIQTNEDKLCSWCSDQLSYCDAYAIFLCLLRRNDNLRPHDDFRGIVFHLSRAILPVNRSRPKSARCFAEIPTPVTTRRADIPLFLSCFSRLSPAENEALRLDRLIMTRESLIFFCEKNLFNYDTWIYI